MNHSPAVLSAEQPEILPTVADNMQETSARPQEACKVVYLDDRAPFEGIVTKETAATTNPPISESVTPQPSDGTTAEATTNLHALFALSSKVHVSKSAASCLQQLQDAKEWTYLVIEVPFDDGYTNSPSTSISTSRRAESLEALYGIHFLRHVTSEIKAQRINAPIMPIILFSTSRLLDSDDEKRSSDKGKATPKPARGSSMNKLRYYEAGAADVIEGPVNEEHVQNILSLADTIYAEARALSEPALNPENFTKRTTWVGMNKFKPYAHLRERMVSELMERIVNPEHVEKPINPATIAIDAARKQVIVAAIGTWDFCSHDFSDDELLHGAYEILHHTLKNDQLINFRLDPDALLTFLLATRKVYNNFVIYHNFRHACDVLQATFFFLISIGAIPPVGERRKSMRIRSPVAALIEPEQALGLLVSALGHDVGHPGVNNPLLVRLNAPLAQLYNDTSVLEAFHSAAYSQILRRYWPAAFSDTNMRRLMISAILSTDMAHHQLYMQRLDGVRQDFDQNGRTLNGSNEAQLNSLRELLGCLLIKCADICNPARSFNIAAEWARLLYEEFRVQQEIERDLSIHPSCLFGGVPERNDIVAIANSQIGFIGIFVEPLFAAVTHLLPAMQFGLDELDKNKKLWRKKVDG